MTLAVVCVGRWNFVCWHVKTQLLWCHALESLWHDTNVRCVKTFWSLCFQLYEEFAEPFSLWECKLAIIHCSGHCDLALVETIWLNIIETELRTCTSIGPNDKMTVLMSKIKALGQEYAGSPRCFPVREYCNTSNGTLLLLLRCMLKNCSL